MNRTASIVTVLIAGAAFLWAGEATAWKSASNWRGGSTEHSPGDTSHQNPWGGSTSHQAGEGTEHTNAYGGDTAHAAGGGTEHTNTYGGSTYGAYGAGVAHTYPAGGTVYYPAYHPPVAVPYYSTGCYGCAAAAGAIAGAAVVAATSSANSASAYSSGYAAGSSAATQATTYVMGQNYAALPAGSAQVSHGGTTYYVSGSTWFQPAYGANGVYYHVVPAP